MVIKGNLITREHAPGVFFSSYKGKYIIMDNMEDKSDPFIHAKEEVYNSDYVYITTVLRGTLYIVVGGTPIEVKANEYLAVTPCMSIVVKDSRCIFFASLVPSYIMAEIYERTDISKKLHFHAFKFRHISLPQELVSALLECYQRIKKEHQRPDYPMKEIVLRAYQSTYLAKFFSTITSDHIINHAKNGRQYKLFNLFIQQLNADHKRERSVQYYATQMQVTPKYLSSIVHNFTGLTASQVIDQYVIFAIKQALYANQHNVKSISRDFNFPSQSFFGRYFKRIVGVSPNEYIKQHNIKSINFV